MLKSKLKINISTKILILSILLIFFGLYQGIGDLTLKSPYLSVDSLFNSYVMEHTFKYFFDSKYQGALFDTLSFYPSKFGMGRSDNLLGTAIIYYAFRTFEDPLKSFVLWIATLYILNYIVFYYFLRKFKISRLLGIVGAYLFSFSFATIYQSGHPQLLPKFWIPLTLLFFFKYLKTCNKKYIIATLTMIFMQIASGIYLGIFLVLLIACYMLSYALLYKKDEKEWEKGWELLLNALPSLLVFIIVTTLFLLPYLYQSLVNNAFFGIEAVQNGTPMLSMYFNGGMKIIASKVFSLFSKQDTQNGEYVITMGATGIILGALIVYGFTKKLLEEKTLKLTLLALILILILTMKLPGGYSLWNIIYYIPGMGSIRALTRIFIIVQMLTILLGLYILNKILLKNKYKNIISILCLFFVLLDQYNFYPKVPYKGISNIYEDIQKVAVQMKPECNVMYISRSSKDIGSHTYQITLSMLATLEKNKYLVNGYTGFMSDSTFFNDYSSDQIKQTFPNKNTCEVVFN